MTVAVKMSFVIPVFNEADNLLPLYNELKEVADTIGQPYEIIFVDDGSSDNSQSVIHSLVEGSQAVRLLSFPKNRGQSAALAGGFLVANGSIIITLDADQQNDPRDIPLMLKAFGPYDMVNGWRWQRRDTVSKRFASRIGYLMRNLLTGDTIKDTGCSLKVMRADLAKRIRPFRGMHRFLPMLMRLEGARVFEIPVNHRPRIRGNSNYSNLRRGIEGFQDLLAVRWMIKRHISIDGDIS